MSFNRLASPQLIYDSQAFDLNYECSSFNQINKLLFHLTYMGDATTLQ